LEKRKEVYQLENHIMSAKEHKGLVIVIVREIRKKRFHRRMKLNFRKNAADLSWTRQLDNIKDGSLP